MPFTTTVPTPHVAALRVAATPQGLRFKADDANKAGLTVAKELLKAGLVSLTGPGSVYCYSITPAGTTELARLDALA